MNLKEVLNQIIDNELDKLIISNKCLKTYEYNKGSIKQIKLKDEVLFQLELFSDTQSFHFNLNKEELTLKLLELAGNFKQMDYYGIKYKALIKYKNLDDIYFKKKMLEASKEIKITSQNRQKQYILAEGVVIPAFVDLKISSEDGEILNNKYDKFKQINRFIEMIDDVISKENFKALNVVDFGCGKSYLTFILYHYLVNVKGIKVKMVGLDLKQDVIDKCNEIAKKYKYDGLHFECGDIKDFKSDVAIDMVVTLHACDIATDLALYHAIDWHTKMLFSVPCCHHELNSNIRTNNFSLLTKYGIIKERLSALMTDAMRCQLLEICGYDTQILEYIDDEGSLKNLLIRAVFKKVPSNTDQQFAELMAIEKEFKGELLLHKLLKANKKILR